MTYDEATEQLSAAIGQPVEYVDVPDPAAREGMIQTGLPEWLAYQLVIPIPPLLDHEGTPRSVE